MQIIINEKVMTYLEKKKSKVLTLSVITSGGG
jgi:hypothetical protein